MDKMDFKGAEEWFVSLLKTTPLALGYEEKSSLIPTNIIIALRIAESLQSGKVSNEMVESYVDSHCNRIGKRNSTVIEDDFKAMAEKLIEECKDDKTK